MKRLALIAATAFLAIPALAAPVRDGQDRAAIDALYGKLTAAMRARNTKAIFALGTPDFSVKERNGQVHNAKDSKAILEAEFKTIKKVNELKMTIRSLKVKGKTATATVDYTMSAVVINAGKPHDMKDKGVTKDTLVNTDKGWKFKSVETLSDNMTMDGQPMPSAPPALKGQSKSKT